MVQRRRSQDWIRAQREQFEARLAAGQVRLEEARMRSRAVDAAVGVVRRERPVAVGILAAALAFRLFALLIPFAYVVVAGLGFFAASTGSEAAQADSVRDLIVGSVAVAAGASSRARWAALLFGGFATLLAARDVVNVLRWVHMLAWRIVAPPRRRNTGLVLGLVGGVTVVVVVSSMAEQARAAASGLAGEVSVLLGSVVVQLVVLAALWFALSWALPRPPVPWTALLPGSVLFAGGFLAFTLAVAIYFAPRAARASVVYGSLGTALGLLIALFLFGRLAVAAAELNAALWERRQERRRTGDPAPSPSA